MSKKHFNALAQNLANTRPSKYWTSQTNNVLDSIEYAQWSRDVVAVAQVCLESSKSFDYQRFTEACKTWKQMEQ